MGKQAIQSAKTGWVLPALLLVSQLSLASHIVGGEITMRRSGTTPGLFAVQMNQFWDEPNTGTGNSDPFVWVGIFRKQDNALMDSLRLPLLRTEPMAYKNALCATRQNLSTLRATYLTTVQLTASRYTSPAGYYITWDRCCRNQAITSFNGTNLLVGMLFYMEFPPVLRNGAFVANSSPEFGLPNGEYICINQPFTTDFSATDADGDELRYSLVTPFRGFSSEMEPIMPVVSRNSFPTIPWGAGLSAQNAIPGSPSLGISPTGQLSVRANRQGLYLFTVQVEEWRNGARIGLVRRDFQLPVIECRATPPPPAVVLSQGQPTTALTVCPPNSVTLTVETDARWSYQWQEDGRNLVGATGPRLVVNQSGSYAVVKSSSTACSSDTLSQVVQVTVAPSLTLTGQTLYRVAAGTSVALPVTASPLVPLTWTPPLYLDNPAADSPLCTPLDSVTYRVSGRTTAGCSASMIVRVELILPAVPARRLFIPSAFSPNGDDDNDVWTLVNAATYPDLEVSVFNRWGEVVFRQKGYATPWAGQAGNVPAPSGTYTYLIRTGTPGEEYRGRLLLLR